MFLRILRKLQAREKEYRVLVLGLDDAGKSTFVGRLAGKSPEELQQIGPTVGFEIVTLVSALSGLTLNIWDIGGQKSLRSFWRNYFEETDALFWVVDATSSEDRLKQSWEELYHVLHAEKLLGVPLVLIYNKCDLPHGATTNIALPDFILPTTPIIHSGHGFHQDASALHQIESIITSLSS